MASFLGNDHATVSASSEEAYWVFSMRICYVHLISSAVIHFARRAVMLPNQLLAVVAWCGRAFRSKWCVARPRTPRSPSPCRGCCRCSALCLPSRITAHCFAALEPVWYGVPTLHHGIDIAGLLPCVHLMRGRGSHIEGQLARIQSNFDTQNDLRSKKVFPVTETLGL